MGGGGPVEGTGVFVSALSARARLFASDAPEQACWPRSWMPQGEKETFRAVRWRAPGTAARLGRDAMQ